MNHITVKEKIEKDLNRFIIYSIIITFLSITILIICSELYISRRNIQNTYQSIIGSYDSLLDSYDNLFEKKYSEDKLITSFYQVNSNNKIKANLFVYNNNEQIIGTNTRLSDSLKTSFIRIIKKSTLNYKAYPIYKYYDRYENYFLITRKFNSELTFLFLIDNLSIQELLLQRKTDQVLIIDAFDNVLATSSLLFQNSLRKIDLSNGSFKTVHGLKYKEDVKPYSRLNLRIVSLVRLTTYYDLVILIIAIQTIIIITYYNYLKRKALIISQDNSEDIEKLINLINKIKLGQEVSYHLIEEENEFKYLGDKIIEMERETNLLFKQKVTLVDTLYQARIKNLETQFQPHFIFNTLENINFLISTNNIEASKYIILLTRLIRYSSDRFTNLVYVKEDMIQIEKYLELLKLRFEENLEYLINIDESSYMICIPKLLIQPLIENSIKYGFKVNTKVKIIINIDIIDEYLVIDVIDNSGGMDISKILNFSKKNNLGINLVKKRVEMLYKDNGAVLFLNEADGLKVKILLKVGEMNV